MALFLEYLHSKSIVYRDLKPENLLIGSDGYLKVTDFGLAKLVEGKTYTLCGTPEYLAPEIVLNKGHDKAVDWWAMGVLMYEMLVGVDPFASDDPIEVYQKALSGKISFPKSFDVAAKSLIKRLLQIDLSKRLGNLKNGIKGIKEHKLFKSFAWDECAIKRMTPPYQPNFRSPKDLKHLPTFSEEEFVAEKPEKDPFLSWIS